jgi:hypothetical protein
MWKWFLSLSLLVLGHLQGIGHAHSREVSVGGVRLSDHTTLAGSDLVLNGAGLRRLFGFQVYVAALYLPDYHHDATGILGGDAPRRLQLTLLRDITTQQNLDALKDGLVANNSPSEIQAVSKEVTRFLDLLRQVDRIPAGTVIRLDYQPGVGTQLGVGNATLGTIPGERFNRALLKIWLGEDPIQVSLKRALLGQDRSTM